jgi:tetratricopeptide (TPR) repeat protein
MSEKPKNSGAVCVALQPSTQQQSPESSQVSNDSGDLKIVSLDPRYSDDEQRSRIETFDRQVDDMFSTSHLAGARELIDTMIESSPIIWNPVQEREDCTVRAFWFEPEVVAYKRAHPKPSKPVVWGVPSLSKLFYLKSLTYTYSSELRFELAHTCLQRGFEYELDHPRLWWAKGELLRFEKRLKEAIEAFRIAGAIRSWTAPTMLAQCMYSQGEALAALHRLTEARDAFARTLELNRNHQDARSYLERVRHDLRQLQKWERTVPMPKYFM